MKSKRNSKKIGKKKGGGWFSNTKGMFNHYTNKLINKPCDIDKIKEIFNEAMMNIKYKDKDEHDFNEQINILAKAISEINQNKCNYKQSKPLLDALSRSQTNAFNNLKKIQEENEEKEEKEEANYPKLSTNDDNYFNQEPKNDKKNTLNGGKKRKTRKNR